MYFSCFWDGELRLAGRMQLSISILEDWKGVNDLNTKGLGLMRYLRSHKKYVAELGLEAKLPKSAFFTTSSPYNNLLFTLLCLLVSILGSWTYPLFPRVWTRPCFRLVTTHFVPRIVLQEEKIQWRRFCPLYSLVSESWLFQQAKSSPCSCIGFSGSADQCVAEQCRALGFRCHSWKTCVGFLPFRYRLLNSLWTFVKSL